MDISTIVLLVVFLIILLGAIFIPVALIVIVYKSVRKNMEEQNKKELQMPIESSAPEKIKPPEFWRLEEQRAFAEATAKSKGLRILPSYSPEEKERKKAARVAIWTEHDAKKSQILAEEVYQMGVKIGIDFFRDLEADSDAIGWVWDIRSDGEVCGHCLSLAGAYRKNVRIPYPAHLGCRCSISVVYKGSRDVNFREYKSQEGTP